MTKTSVRKASRAAKSSRGSVKKSAKVGAAAKRAAKPAAKSARSSSSRGLRSKAAGKASRVSARTPAPKSANHIIVTASPPVAPLAPPPIVVRSHKYKVGEVVYYTSPSFGRAAATGSYTVVKQLPSEGDDYQYRIKSSGEAFERVAKESQLDRA